MWDQHWTILAEAARINPAQDLRRRLVRSSLGLRDSGVGAVVVDFGSGIGCQIVDLAKIWPEAKYIGIDRSYEGLRISARRMPSGAYICQDLSFQRLDGELDHGIATHGVCTEVLEHVQDPDCVLDNIRKFLAPNGRLVVTVPGGPISAFDRHIGHLRHYTEDSLCQMLQRAGFRRIKVKRHGFPFFDLYRLLIVLLGNRVTQRYQQPPSSTDRVLMLLLRILFLCNSTSGKRGFQLLAVAEMEQ